MGKPSANIVTISHPKVQSLVRRRRVRQSSIVTGPGEYELADTLIAGVATSMEPRVGPTNTAYVFRVEDMNICHLGDLRDKLTDKQVEEIGSIDVLLVPVGGGNAIGPLKLPRSSRSSSRRWWCPCITAWMEYRQTELEPVDPFCREVGLKEYVPEPKLSITKGSLSSEVRIVVLENKRV